jgi:PAS domain S-box-containing protein
MINVLYVDDDPGLLEVGKLFLERSGQFSVDIIASAPAALSLLNSKDYDAIVSDYQMPEMDGIEFLKRVRTSGNTIPFILFTGRGREEVVIQALNEGADFYLQKGGEPTSQFTELIYKTRQAVQQRIAAASIRDHERRETDLLNFLPDPTFAIDAKGSVIMWNRAMEEMTGVKSAGILGKDNYEYAVPIYHECRPMLVDLVHDPDEQFEKEKYRSVIHNHTTMTAETTIEKNGQPVHLWGKASCLFDQQGNLAGAIESIRDITTRRQAEHLLQESEKKYRRIVDTAEEGIWQMDENLDTVYVNRRMTEMLGYTSEEMIGRNIASFTAAEDIPDHTTRIEERRQGKSGRYERRFITKGGSIRWMQVSATPLMDPHGTFLGSFAMYSDITERKKAEIEIARRSEELHAAYEQLTATEEQLRQNYHELVTSQKLLSESEQRYRNVIEDQTEFISRFLPDGTHVFVNEAYCRYFGLRRDEIFGHRFRPKIPAEDQERMRQFFESLTVDHPVDNIEHRIIMPDGQVRWQRWSDRAIFDPSGKVIEYQSVGRDITGYKCTEEALLRSDARQKAMTANITDIIAIIDAEGIIRYTSGNIEKIFGWEPGELIGRSYTETAHPDDRECITGVFQTLIQEKNASTTVEYRYKLKDGSFKTIYLTAKNLVHDPFINGILVNFHDISERKLAEDNLVLVNRKLNVLSQLTRHDVITQIYILNSYLELAKIHAEGCDEIVKNIESGEQVVRSLKEITEFTKDYQHLGEKPPRWQNVKLAFLFGITHISPGGICSSIETENLEIFADPLLEKAFRGLIENSLAQRDRVSRIRVWYTEIPEGATIFLEDDGPGIPLDKKEGIFLLGKGTRASIRGLFYVREILDLTGITIRETGKPGAGARFEMVVPKGAYRFSEPDRLICTGCRPP